MIKYFLSFLFLISLFPQSPKVTPARERLDSFAKRKQLEKLSPVQNIEFRNIGPTVFGGRAIDVDVNPDDPTQFYVAFASGGLWVTRNNGISFDPLFQDQAAMTIGDIKVDWKNGETIWVGTGESNAFLFSGLGIYKSTDKGKNWQHFGLEETHSISRIQIHPVNSNIVWAASPGHLYTPNKERGVFKTYDGGKTWKQTLFVSDSAGITELIIDPNNPDVLYAASWERYRKAWKRQKSGAGSGIYKSTDGGESWSLLSTATSGFPTGKGVGRIGLTIFPQNSNILYAMLDNQTPKPSTKTEEKSSALSIEKLKKMTKEDFLKLDDKNIETFLRENYFPQKYSSASVKEMVRSDKIQPVALAEYLEDPGTAMVKNVQITGCEVYRSNDAGKTWSKTHDKPLDNIIYTYGYVFDVIKVDPNNSDKFYIAGVPILKSEDAGKTFKSIDADNVHVDHHSLWVNPNKPGHLINCNDGGINISYDDGATWLDLNSIPVGQIYSVNYDMKEPYNVYGGFQDNGVWYGPSTYNYSRGWYAEGNYPYKNLMGGDGFQTQIDHRDNKIVYTGYQYGSYYRINTENNDYKYIQPKHELGEKPLKYNWQTPILLSRHNQDILYFGANRLYRSLDKGDNFTAISPDLSKGGRPGDVPYGTITCISESSFKFGQIFVGTDDGLIQYTPDGGNTWKNISAGLPQDYMVTSVNVSQHSEGRVYISMTGLKWDNSEPQIYSTEDYGKHWKKITGGLPFEAVNIVCEDPKNENILYAGTENGLYVSFDRGNSYYPFTTTQLPAVSVYDIKIHPRDNDLIVGTHGRSIYIANISHVQSLTKDIFDKTFHLFEIKGKKFNSNWGKKATLWSEPSEGKIVIPYYSKSATKTKIQIKTVSGVLINEFYDDAEAGLNYASYDLSVLKTKINDYQNDLNKNIKNKDEKITLTESDNQKVYLQKGKYKISLSSENNSVEGEFEIK